MIEGYILHMDTPYDNIIYFLYKPKPAIIPCSRGYSLSSQVKNLYRNTVAFSGIKGH